MLLSKRCPRCGGNLLVGYDLYGRYATCMQCGRGIELPRESSRLLADFNDENEPQLAEVGGKRRRQVQHS